MFLKCERKQPSQPRVLYSVEVVFKKEQKMKAVFDWSKKALDKERGVTREIGTYFERNDKEHPSYKYFWIHLKWYLQGNL